MEKSDTPRTDEIPDFMAGDGAQLLLQGLPNPLWHCTSDGRRDWFNRAWLEFTGRGLEQECNEGWWDSVHADDLHHYLESFNAAVEARRAYELELRLRHRDGPFHWFKERGQPLFDAQGVYQGYIGVCEALDEQRCLQQALLESEGLFQSVVEQNIAGIYIIVDDKFVYVNPAFSEVVGFPKEEIIGRHYFDFVIEEDRPLVAANIRRRLTGKAKSVQYSFRGRRRDGALVDVGVHGGLAIYRGREAIIGVAQDITELKQAEARIHEDAARLERTMLGTLEALSVMSELRDPYTVGHERHVGDLAAAIGLELGLSEEQVKGLRVIGYLHDIGKITVPSEILSKPRHLTPAEFELIKTHPQAGYEILKSVEFPWAVVEAILQHHEHLDGSGYPHGLKGDEIGLEARIIAVADIVEAMAHHRPYRPVVGLDNALNELRAGAGTHYDPIVVEACLRLFQEGRFQWHHELPPLAGDDSYGPGSAG